jgi:Rod binding domain-containing protein
METLPGIFQKPADAVAQTAKAPKFAKDMSPEKIRETGEEFESFFLSQFLGQMFSGIKTDGPFGGGHGESMFQEMQFKEYATAIANNGGVGIADPIVRQLINTQEVPAENARGGNAK